MRLAAEWCHCLALWRLLHALAGSALVTRGDEGHALARLELYLLEESRVRVRGIRR